MTKKLHLNYVHNFRGVAIILIVILHCTFWRPFNWTGYEDLSQFLRFLSNRSTAYFIFIGGFLFQYLSYKYAAKTYFRSKLFNVVLPYLLISIPAIYKAILEGTAFVEYPIWFQIIAYYLTGAHFLFFWFIPVIVLIYFLSPLLVKLDKSQYFYYTLPLFFILSILVDRDYHNPFQSLAHYIYFYLLGMAVSHYREKFFSYMQNYWLIYGGVFCIILYVDYILRANYLEQVIYVSRYTFGCLFILFVLYRFDKQVGTTFRLFGDMSFGIYFLHGYVLSLLWRIGGKLSLTTPYVSANIVSYLLLLISVLLISYLVLWFVKKVFGKRSRMLTGY
jgi:surface polysaccharide O-acyltransferase-like enzyme